MRTDIAIGGVDETFAEDEGVDRADPATGRRV